jgi:RNA-binding protein
MSTPTMPATSARKRHLMPSGKLRKSLREHGHALSVIVQVGKAGVTPALVKQLEKALDDHELVKIKVAPDGPADRFAAAEQLAALGGVNVVQIVGNILLLYKRHPRVARYEGKLARPAGASKDTDQGPKVDPKVDPRKGRKKQRKNERKRRSDKTPKKRSAKATKKD